MALAELVVQSPSQAALYAALFAIRIAAPAVLLLLALSFFFRSPPPQFSTDEITPVIVAQRTPRRSLVTSLLSLLSLTYFLDGLALVLHSILTNHWEGTPPLGKSALTEWAGVEIEAVLGLLASSLLAIALLYRESRGVSLWEGKSVRAWTVLNGLGTLVEVVLIAITVDFTGKKTSTRPTFTALLHTIFPVLRLLLVLVLYPTLVNPRISYVPASSVSGVAAEDADEDTSLLHPAAEAAAASQGRGLSVPGHGVQYGTFRSGREAIVSTGTNTRSQTPAPAGEDQLPLPIATSGKTSKNAGNRNGSAGEASGVGATGGAGKEKVDVLTWAKFWRRLKRISPYLWPKKSASLQGLAFLCILLIVVGRFVNAALPLTLGQLLRVLEEEFGGEQPTRGSGQSYWPWLLAYVGLRFLQGSGGIAAVRDTLWAPVMQYSDREMSQLTFTHLLSLSLAFHTRRKTGEILRILDRGAAINRIFQLFLFNVVPTFLDIFIALGVFVGWFGWQLSMVVGFVMAAYIFASIVMTTWRTKIRREMNERDVVARGIHTDCLLNYETVKYFCGENFESDRYADAIREYQHYEYQVVTSLNALNLVQNLIITLGLLVGSIIVAVRVTHVREPYQFVVFITYLAQLYGPLNQLGFIYRSLNTSMIDAEKLMKLLDEPTDVNDKPGAPDLVVDGGVIEFENVSFSYDARVPALQNVSFTVPRGSSVALVGESGSGKSTILRLLYRFYDLQEGQGRILIDGQDIRDVKQESLRRVIGVVPQDSVLFNASVGYNIGYGKFGASPEEIVGAAKAAQMHERIMSFPDGYDTKVGERGVRLSGGEKQRVAIARTLLKNPPVLLLDEATSALDTSTERDIQKALQNLVKGRSSLSIAHRLSTIANADIILVLNDGQIVERGNHRELLAQGGIFASMWEDQISAEDRAGSIAGGSLMKKEVDGYEVDVPPAAPPSAPVVGVSTSEVAIDDLPTQDTTVDEEVAVVDGPQPKLEVQATDSPTELTVPLAEDIPSTEQIVETETRDGSKDAPGYSVEPEAGETNGDKKSYAAVAASAPPADSDAPVIDTVPPPQPAPVAFPSTEGPVSFPIVDDTSSQRSEPPIVEPTPVSAPVVPSPAPAPGVTFPANVDERPSSRSATPDPENGPKRKRISSQNFQRLARRISLGPKRSASAILSGVTGGKVNVGSSSAGGSGSASANASTEGLGRKESPRGSVDESPAGSLKGEEGKKEKKKKEKKKRFSTSVSK